MTPLGHLAISYIASKAIKRSSRIGCLLGGAAPDFDFALLPFSFFNSIHRVVSHNIFYVLAVGGAMSVFFAKRRFAVFVSAALCGCLHLFIDSILDDNPTNGLGVAVFWPLSDWMFQPFNLVAPIPGSGGWNDAPRALMNALGIMLIEIPFYIAALALLWFERRAVEEENPPE